jgi:FkbM family methyltransferase
MARLGALLKALHGRLLRDCEGALRLLRRLTPLRRLYVRLVDPDRHTLFSLSHWVQTGLKFQAGGCFDRICFESGQAWVHTSAGLDIGFMTEIAGGGLDADLYAGRYAPALNRIIADLLPPGAVMIDVGANIGWVALNAAVACRDAQVYAFEPGDFAFSYLRANVERNEMTSRITAINKAVADVTTTMQFTNDPFAHPLNHLERGRTDSGLTVPVETITLDDFVAREGLHRIDLIKCDVEGAELLVLQGARNAIDRFRPTFVLEVDGNWLKRFGATPEDVIDFLASRGYEYRVDREASEVNWIFFPLPSG